MEQLLLIGVIAAASVVLWRFLSKRIDSRTPPQTHQPHSPSGTGYDKGAIARSVAEGHSINPGGHG